MIYVLLENETPDDNSAKGRNQHIAKTATTDSETFPNIFGQIVKTAQEVEQAAANERPQAFLHLFAHGNQNMVGPFQRANRSDTTAALAMTDFLCGDIIKIQKNAGIRTIRFHSCFASSHLPQLGVALGTRLPTGRVLTLEGAYQAAYTDAAGNLRSAKGAPGAELLDAAVQNPRTTSGQFNRLIEQHCFLAGQGVKAVTVKGSYG